jgi:hypothetical protein
LKKRPIPPIKIKIFLEKYGTTLDIILPRAAWH